MPPLPPNDSPTPRQGQIIRRMEQAEDSAVVRLLKLLEQAREELEGQDNPTAEAMLQAVEAQAQRLNSSLQRGMSEATGEAANLGVRLAETGVRAPVPFALSDELLTALSNYQATLITAVSDELRHALTGQIQLGLLAGTSTEEIGRRLVAEGLEGRGPWQSAEARAEVVVRTELNRVASMATHARGLAAAEDVPGLLKVWISASDARVRDSHRAMNGVAVPVADDFLVAGEYPAQHPHDPRLPASESVQCRCRCIFRAPDDE